MRLRASLTAGLPAIVAALVLASSAAAAWPGRNGSIVIGSSVSCSGAPGEVVIVAPGTPCNGLWSIEPDGSGLRPLTAAGTNIFDADFSPDGRRLAVQSPGLGLLLLDPAGRLRGVLGTRNPYPGFVDPPIYGFVTWLPGGGRLGGVISTGKTRPVPGEPYCTDRAQTIATVDTRGQRRRRVATPTRYAIAPTWSAHGDLIAWDGFNRMRFRSIDETTDCLVEQRDALWVMRAGRPGTAARLAAIDNPPSIVNSYRQGPDFSPDGKQIAFVSDFRVKVIRTNGSGLRTIRGSHGAQSVTWSPDGHRIAWTAVKPPEGTPTRAVLRQAGANGRRLRDMASWDLSFSRCGGCGLAGLTWQPVPAG